MDGRKNNGGHKTAGRKTKADEIKVIEAMDAVLAPAKVWKALADKVKEGDWQCIKTWLSYRYGMPKQQADISLGGVPQIIWNEQRNYTKEERDKRIDELIEKRSRALQN